ncbi:hypothetical protein N6H18_05960 [Reichenbachiella agarivorans]|uniref:Uncharacterized protein n=1 Tax=Reichenbachiella agarivorans TaxID=2979464 RepID=A0ABY6CSM6_9BACT|nr:hypothetical protein [Reichenbachiella agarivorans]UXP33496.1 hypothetical protein N6H18_05960 [Reichenbachiella agarivorans]
MSEKNILESFLKSEAVLSVSLDRTLQQEENGKTSPHTEVKKKYEKWI